jgi:CRP-like cAMP-binding protein
MLAFAGRLILEPKDGFMSADAEVNDTDFPAIVRLSALAPLDGQDRALLRHAIGRARRFPIRQELISERHPIPGILLIVSGWAARVRILPDGRRQFLSFLLPGDLIGLCYHHDPLAVSTVSALTEVTACTLPDKTSPRLAEALRVSYAREEAYLLAQITRLGRLSAEERIGDLLLEFDERLGLAGLTRGNSFEVPLTQEMLADAVGLTSVHVNRMLQQLRRSGELEWKGSQVTLTDPAQFALRLGRNPVQVSACHAERDS